ncbi:MAG: fibronectin type III domain-containing protein [Anaerovoracaceae bacterium]|jgi:hypothetical protein
MERQRFGRTVRPEARRLWAARRGFFLLLALLLAAAMLLPAGAEAAVTTAKTPNTLGQTRLAWQKKFGSGSGMAMVASTPPLCVGDVLYVGMNKKIYRLSRSDGSEQKASETLAGDMGYATLPLTFDQGTGRIFAAVQKTESGSKYTTLTCLDAETLEILWTSSWFKGQNLCPVTVIDGRAYTGTWRQTRESGKLVSRGCYFCVDAGAAKTDREVAPIWETSAEDSTGYYWAGAVKTGKYVIFGSDNGVVYSIAADAGSWSPKTCDELAQSGSENGVIRSTPAVVSAEIGGGSGDSVYLTCRNGSAGKLARLTVDSDGTPVLQDSTALTAGSTNTPVVVPSAAQMYFGTDNGTVCRVDPAKAASAGLSGAVTELDKAPGAIKGEILASTGNEEEVDLYMTCNDSTGGIYMIRLDAAGTKKQAAGMTFYPAYPEYCTSTLTAGADGTLYYRNDALYLMAVQDGLDKSAPGSIGVKAVNYRQARITWSPCGNAKSYQVYRSTHVSSGWKKAAEVSGRSLTQNGLKTGTRYYYKVRAVLSGGVCSSFSAVKSVRTALRAPASIRTKAGKRKITLRWSRVAGASGYRIYRAAKKNGRYKCVKKCRSAKWTDKKLKRHRRYYYKVRAYRAVDGRTVCGGWSKISGTKAK